LRKTILREKGWPATMPAAAIVTAPSGNPAAGNYPRSSRQGWSALLQIVLKFCKNHCFQITNHAIKNVIAR